MDIYQLRYFVAVAESGNFTKAAARSNISQPSLSQQILNLESELNQPLFHRLGRRVTLTDAGQLLLARARRIISETDDTIRELKEDPSFGHRVSVGAIPTVAHFFLHAVVAYCRASGINIKLRSREDFRGAIITAVLEGELDWGMISLPLAEPNLEVVPLFTEPLLLAIGAQHHLAKASKITLADLRDENFIMTGNASSVTSLLLERFSGEHAFTPNITHRCAQLSTVKSLTALGLGVTVLPRSARNVNDPEGLIYRKLEGPPLTREIALIRHKRRYLSKGAQLFADAARAVVGPHVSAPPFPLPATATI